MARALHKKPDVLVDSITSGAIRVLLVEDDPDDYVLLRSFLSEIPSQSFHLDRARNFEEGLKAIQLAAHDIYLLDYCLGDHNGLELMAEAKKKGTNAPFILLTGVGTYELDIQAMRTGAADYLPKQELSADLLERSIRYAIQRARVMEALVEETFYDVLTGLPNRTLLLDRLERAAERARRRRDAKFGLLFVDLDNFKQVNDTLGHLIGDQVLLIVRERLLASVRPPDTVARFGGDEFVILLEDLRDTRVAVSVAERILTQLRTPANIQSHNVIITASIGIVTSDHDLLNPQQLLNDADAAMYRAKALGKDCHVISQPLNKNNQNPQEYPLQNVS